jgi:hypothetical protein
MAKSVDVVFQINENLQALQQSMVDFTAHQLSMIENYQILMQNQLKVTDNHDIVVENQKKIIQNQGIITHNQTSIISNQAVIVKNQAYLRTLIHAQAKLIALVSNKTLEEVNQELDHFLENAQLEISKGFEKPVSL